MDGDSQSDFDLLQAARNGDGAAWANLVRRWAGLLYGCCAKVFGETECESEYPALVRRLKADRMALLADWDGRSSFAAFLALKAADLLALRIIALLAEYPPRGWAAFEQFFSEDLRRMVRRRLSATDNATEEGEDLLQDLRLRLMADGGRAIQHYDGRGSFTGYVRRIAHNLLEDILRARDGRRREPEAVQRLPAMERRAYHLVHVQGYRADQLASLLRDDDGAALTQAEALNALGRAEAAMDHRPAPPHPRTVPLIIAGQDGREWERPLPQWAPSPEESLAASRERAELERACSALAAAMARLPVLARQYLRLRFLEDPPLPPRRIAERLNLPVEELYRRRKSWESLLLTELRTEGVTNFPLSSV